MRDHVEGLSNLVLLSHTVGKRQVIEPEKQPEVRVGRVTKMEKPTVHQRYPAWVVSDGAAH